jgi:hypothetical protein
MNEREELLTVAEAAEWLKLNPQTVRGARRVRIRQSTGGVRSLRNP